jgi:hypothetical protein
LVQSRPNTRSKSAQTKPQTNKLISMINLIKSAILGFALVGVAQAATLDRSDSRSLITSSTSTFTFNKFDTSLGVLSAVNLLITSSTPTGSAAVTNNSPTSLVDVLSIDSRIQILGNATLGLSSGYTGNYTNLDTTPDALFYPINPLSSQTFTVDSGQSLIGSTTVSLSISNGSLSAYQGSGNVSFRALTGITLNTIGSTYSVDSSLYSALTSMTLRYTYTPASPSPVPETGQVAASLLLLGGIGGYIFIKRRRKQAVAAA